jgi:hypothetical protein
MRAKEYWVIMCSSMNPNDRDWLQQDLGTEVDLFEDKAAALIRITYLTSVYAKTVFTLYHLVPTEHTTHKR